MSAPYNFTQDDKMNPVYCVGCRQHIPRLMSNANRGLCDSCKAKLQAPPPIVARIQQNVPTQVQPPQYQSPIPPVRTPAQKAKDTKQALTAIGATICVVIMIVFFVWLNASNRAQEAKEQEKVIQDKVASGQLAPGQTPSGNPAEDAKIAQQMREQQAAQVRENQQYMADVALRGPRPKESEWDGITPEANDYLKSTLRDYDSMQIVNCYKVVPYDKGDVHAWAQMVEYRARNGFGGMNLVVHIFIIKNGRVIDEVNSDEL